MGVLVVVLLSTVEVVFNDHHCRASFWGFSCCSPLNGGGAHYSSFQGFVFVAHFSAEEVLYLLLIIAGLRLLGFGFVVCQNEQYTTNNFAYSYITEHIPPPARRISSMQVPNQN